MASNTPEMIIQTDIATRGGLMSSYFARGTAVDGTMGAVRERLLPHLLATAGCCL